MNNSFRDGYEFFHRTAGNDIGALLGGAFGSDRASYVESVQDELNKLEDSINAFAESGKSVKQLKGDIAEFWHAGTFNFESALHRSSHRAEAIRENGFASVDVASNFGEKYGLKYYKNFKETAKQQAKTYSERFHESTEGKTGGTFEDFLSSRGLNDSIDENDPIYMGQTRIVPSDQIDDMRKLLADKIEKEASSRPDQVKRYQDTLDFLRTKIEDGEGNESIELTKDQAEEIARLAKEGDFDASDFDMIAPELIELEMLIKESLNAGCKAAVLSLVLRVGPEIYKAIDYLIKNGEIDEDEFKRIGFAAVSGATEGFVRGSVAAAITACCKSGVCGEALKEVSSGAIGAVVAITMNTIKNSYQVSIGKKSREEMTDELIRDMIVSSSSIALGCVGQTILAELPAVGYMIGSFVGSIAGSFIYNTGYKATISFCIDTGLTMFGLVDQDYKLPDEIIKELGIETFEYESLFADSFEVETFEPESFEIETFKPDNIGISVLRRGVIGVSRIGYV